MRTFKVRCDASLAQRFEAVAALAAEAEAVWVAEKRQQIDVDAAAYGWSTAQHSQARRDLRARQAQLRRAGELRGTHGLTLLPALRAQLAERGWLTRRWRNVPPGAGHGRPWGAPDQGFRGKVILQLPDDVAQVVLRGSYWSSLPHVRRLQEWTDRNSVSRARVSQPQLETRRQISAKIVTAHDVLRQAMVDTCENAASAT